MNSGSAISRTTPALFRDCLRLIIHIAGKSKKGEQLRRIVGGEFRKNAKVSDEATITALKSNAIRALANYLMIESSAKDARFNKRSLDYSARTSDTLHDTQKTDGSK